MDIGTYDDDEVQIVGDRCAREVGASKPSPTEHRKKSPSSLHKSSTKRTSHERSPQPRKGISIGGDGGDEENEGETEEQKKRR